MKAISLNVIFIVLSFYLFSQFQCENWQIVFDGNNTSLSSQPFSRGIYYIDQTKGYALAGAAPPYKFVSNYINSNNWYIVSSFPDSMWLVDFRYSGNSNNFYFLANNSINNNNVNLSAAYFYSSFSSLPVLIANNGFSASSMDFINPTTGWVVGSNVWCNGNCSNIYKTTNGGQTWYPLNFPYYSLLGNVDFLNENFGVVCSEAGVVYKTNDGGQTWQNISPFFGTFTSVKIVNNDVIYLTGYKSLGGGNTKDYILKTTNSGLSWDTLYVGNNIYIEGIQILDNYIIAGGWEGKILFSENEGQTFNLETDAFGNYCYDGASIVKNNNGEVFIRVATSTCVTYGTPKIFEKLCLPTVYWHEQYAPAGVNFINEASFIDSLKGWAVTSWPPAQIIKTTNGGQTWSLIYSNSNQVLKDIYFIDENNGWVVGNDGLIMYTNNGGSNWTIQNSNTTQTLLSVYFINQQKGWACGYGGTILSTNDGGNTWVHQSAPVTEIFYSIYFINENNGAIAGDFGYVLTTNDGGNTWSAYQEIGKESKKIPTFYDVIMINSNKIIAVGTYSTIEISQDGGNTWTKYTLTADDITAIDFYDELHGYVVDVSANIFKTFDGGLTWHKLYTGNLLQEDVELLDVVTTDSNNVWVFGGFVMTNQAPKILHSNNGGGTPILSSNIIPSVPEIFITTNSFENEIIISFAEAPKSINLHIYNILGQLIYNQQSNEEKHLSISMSNFANGPYLIVVKTEKFNKVIKIIKN
ncbi:MAG: YCF48-related protein [Bacteroidales bacterium]|nr:YCF48-related protein [Bacteroidales bacterium]